MAGSMVALSLPRFRCGGSGFPVNRQNFCTLLCAGGGGTDDNR